MLELMTSMILNLRRKLGQGSIGPSIQGLNQTNCQEEATFRHDIFEKKWRARERGPIMGV